MPTRTLTTNVQEKLKNIPFDTLNKSFQDAYRHHKAARLSLSVD